MGWYARYGILLGSKATRLCKGAHRFLKLSTEVFPCVSLLCMSTAVARFTELELMNLLRVSRLNNTPLDITAMLLLETEIFSRSSKVLRRLPKRCTRELRVILAIMRSKPFCLSQFGNVISQIGPWAFRTLTAC